MSQPTFHTLIDLHAATHKVLAEQPRFAAVLQRELDLAFPTMTPKANAHQLLIQEGDRALPRSLYGYLTDAYALKTPPTFNQAATRLLMAQAQGGQVALNTISPLHVEQFIERFNREPLRCYLAALEHHDKATAGQYPQALGQLRLQWLEAEMQLRDGDGTLPAQAFTLIQQVLDYPAWAQRLALPPSQRVLVRGVHKNEAHVAATYVLSSDEPDFTTVVLYSAANGVEVFDSFTQLDDTLAQRLGSSLSYPEEPASLFEAWVAGLHAAQRTRIRDAHQQARTLGTLQSLPVLVGVLDGAANEEAHWQTTGARTSRYQALWLLKQPQWLADASIAQRTEWVAALRGYRQVLEHSQVPVAAGIRAYGQLPTLRAHARDLLQARIKAEQGLDLDPDHLLINTTTALRTGALSYTGIYSPNSYIAGASRRHTGPTVTLTRMQRTLSQLVLDNQGLVDADFWLTARISDLQGNTVTGLTASQVRTHVRALDFANQYDALLKDTLLDGPGVPSQRLNFKAELQARLHLDAVEAHVAGELSSQGKAWLEGFYNDVRSTTAVHAYQLHLQGVPVTDVVCFKREGNATVVLHTPEVGRLRRLHEFADEQAMLRELVQPQWHDYLLQRMGHEFQAATLKALKADVAIASTHRFLADFFTSQYDLSAQLARRSARAQSTSTPQTYLNDLHAGLLIALDVASTVLPLKVLLPLTLSRSLWSLVEFAQALKDDDRSAALQHFLDAIAHLTDASSDLAGGSMLRGSQTPTRSLSRLDRGFALAHKPQGLKARQDPGYEGVLERHYTDGRQPEFFIEQQGHYFQARRQPHTDTWHIVNPRNPTGATGQPVEFTASGHWQNTWVDQLAGGSPRDDARRLKTLLRQHSELVDKVNDLPGFETTDVTSHVNSEALYQAARKAHTDLIDGHRTLEGMLAEIKELSRDRKQRGQLVELHREATTSASNWLQNRLHLDKARLDRLNQEVQTAAQLLSRSRERSDLVQRIRDTQRAMLGLHDGISTQVAELTQWAKREQSARPGAVGEYQKTIGVMTHGYYRYKHINTLLDLVHDLPDDSDTGWDHMLKLDHIRERLNRSVRDHHDLQDLLMPDQQRQVYTTGLEHLREYQGFIASTSVMHPEYYDLGLYPRAMGVLDQFIDTYESELARLARPVDPAASARPNPPRPARQPSRAPARRAFETPDNRHYVAEEVDDSPTLARYTLRPTERLYTLDGVNGAKEHWAIGGDGRGRHLNPVAARAPKVYDQQRVINEAKALLGTLDKQILKAQAYINYSPRNLEHTYQALARQLRDLATRVTELAPLDPSVAALTKKATDLEAAGRQRRLQTTLTWATPQAGDLEFVLAQGAVDIAHKRRLPSQSGATDFVVEYEIRDLGQQPPVAVWYAHFHYPIGETAFAAFTAAHIKLKSQRSLGKTWQAAHGDEARVHRGVISRELAEAYFAGIV